MATTHHVVHTHEGTAYPATAIETVSFTMQRVVYFALSVLLSLLGVRFFLRFFGANPANDFVEFIYNLTGPLVTPFSGIFGPVSAGGVAAFEVSTIIAGIVYSLIAYGLVRLIAIITTTPEVE